MAEKMKTNQVRKVMGWLLVIGFAMSPFQNCGRTTVSNSLFSLKMDGNATGYDGQIGLSGTYLQWIPGYTCPQSSSPLALSNKAAIQFGIAGDPQGIYLTGDACNPQPVPITIDTLEVAAYNLDLMGRGALIFEKKVDAVPLKSIQIWCREGRSSDVGLDVIVRQTADGTLTTAEIIIAERVSTSGLAGYRKHSVAPFAVSMNTGTNGTSVTAPGFDLSLTNIESVDAGKYQANLKSVIDDAERNASLLCRRLSR